jgi:hypothetical protein
VKRNLSVVVSGYVGMLPAGGVTWDYIQYAVGFRELGCNVLYLEDTQAWPVYNEGTETSCEPNVAYLASVMKRFEMSENWAYRDEVTGQCFGMSSEAIRRFCESADLLVNISCSMPLREEYLAIPLRVMVDTDPMFTQVQCATGRTMYGGRSSLPEMIRQHTHLFTFGESVGQPGCCVPSVGQRWLATRQPVVLRYWPAAPEPETGAYTSIFNWAACQDFEYMGRRWGQKNMEFKRFLDVPQRAGGVSFRVGVGCTVGGDPFPADAARRVGWEVADPKRVSCE